MEEDKSAEVESKAVNNENPSVQKKIPKSPIQKRLERLLLFFRDSRKPRSPWLWHASTLCWICLQRSMDWIYFTCKFVSAMDFKSDMHGENEAKLKNIFNVACQDGPGILVIDEVDSMISNRDRDGKLHEDSKVSAGIKNLQFDYFHH